MLGTNLNRDNKSQGLSIIAIRSHETINDQGSSNETLIEIIIETVVTVNINQILAILLTQTFSTLFLTLSISNSS